MWYLDHSGEIGQVLSMDLLLYVSLLLTASGKPWRNMTCTLGHLTQNPVFSTLYRAIYRKL